jgi:poly-beta-1,6-N-acetyl-D-glucosamine synthase
LGALQAAWQYGLTQHTSVFHRLQALNLLGIAATLIYLSTLAAALLTGPGLHVKEIWLWVTLVYMIERTITVWRRGWEARVMAFLLLPEMIFDITLQLVQLRAITSWVMRRKQKDWYGGTH